MPPKRGERRSGSRFLVRWVEFSPQRPQRPLPPRGWNPRECRRASLTLGRIALPVCVWARANPPGQDTRLPFLRACRRSLSERRFLSLSCVVHVSLFASFPACRPGRGAFPHHSRMSRPLRYSVPTFSHKTSPARAVTSGGMF